MFYDLRRLFDTEICGMTPVLGDSSKKNCEKLKILATHCTTLLNIPLTCPFARPINAMSLEYRINSGQTHSLLVISWCGLNQKMKNSWKIACFGNNHETVSSSAVWLKQDTPMFWKLTFSMNWKKCVKKIWIFTPDVGCQVHYIEIIDGATKPFTCVALKINGYFLLSAMGI